MPFRGFIAAFATKGQPFLSQSCAGLYPSCAVVKSKGPAAGQTPLALLALLQFALPLPLQFANLAAETTYKGCPQRCLFFRTCSGLHRCFEAFRVGFAQVLDVGHQLINFKHNARVFVEICRDGFGHILQFIL